MAWKFYLPLYDFYLCKEHDTDIFFTVSNIFLQLVYVPHSASDSENIFTESVSEPLNIFSRNVLNICNVGYWRPAILIIYSVFKTTLANWIDASPNRTCLRTFNQVFPSFYVILFTSSTCFQSTHIFLWKNTLYLKTVRCLTVIDQSQYRKRFSCGSIKFERKIRTSKIVVL